MGRPPAPLPLPCSWILGLFLFISLAEANAEGSPGGLSPLSSLRNQAFPLSSSFLAPAPAGTPVLFASIPGQLSMVLLVCLQAMPQLTDRSKVPNIVDPIIRDTMDLKHLYQVCFPFDSYCP
ncbi:hypothetical protein GW17_00025856 [Ensete ventricosum]|nr:hypothetical protein GW17_00025856 [Ensete ventricosum]